MQLYISAVYYSRAKNVIALDYYFSETKDSQEYSVSAFSKKSRKIDKILYSRALREELRKKSFGKVGGAIMVWRYRKARRCKNCH